MDMKILVIAIAIFAALWSFFLKVLNYSNRNAPLPTNVKDVFDPEEYKKSKAYGAESMRFGMFSGLVSSAVMVIILILNVHSRLFYFIADYTDNFYLQVYFMFAAIWFITMPVDAALDAIDTFKVEAKYGFNKTRPITFIADIFKNGLLQGMMLLGLLSAFIWLYGLMGNWVFVGFFFVLLVFIVLMVFSQIIIMRLFYKFKPLEEGSLRTRAEELAKTLGFPVKRILVLNASKRSTKSNAFFTGIGKTKTIGLFDTLLEKFTEDEVLSILAHEIGHAKERHIIKSAPIQFLMFAVIMAAAFFVVGNEAISTAFGFTEINIAFGLLATMIVASPLFVILNIPAAILSRKHEYEADSYEVKYVGKTHAISAIKKLYATDYGNLTPHPLVVQLTYSHPTLTQRVAAMEKQ